jgi:hypothetical protein
MGFDPYNCSMKIWKFIGTPTSKMGTHLGVWVFIPSYSLTLPRAWDVILGLPSWPASPCLGREPKDRIATKNLIWKLNGHIFFQYKVDVDNVEWKFKIQNLLLAKQLNENYVGKCGWIKHCILRKKNQSLNDVWLWFLAIGN